MLTTLSITIPIFILIAIGFFAVRSGFLRQAETRVLVLFVMNFALPALLFKAMAERPLGDLLNFRVLAIYTLGSLVVFGGALGIALLVKKSNLQDGAILAMGTSVCNSAFIGFPIALQLFGSAASANLAIYVAVETVIMLPLMMTLAELGGSTGTHWTIVLRDIFCRLLKNPLIVAIFIGVVFSALELTLPLPLSRATDLLSGAAAPVALFYIGCVLASLSLKGMVGDIGGIVIGKLILHPLAVFAMFLLIPLDDPMLKMALVINAGMPMMSMYPILGQKYGKEAICSAAVVATTVTSFVTISGLIWMTGAG